MSDVTRILDRIDQGDPTAAERLLPIVYEELRKLAAERLTHEKSGQTLQATALVHEAYLRLLGNHDSYQWNSRGHFFAAAAEAMRRILVDNARRKKRAKHGGDRAREPLDADRIAAPASKHDLLALNAALDQLANSEPRKCELVNLRYFGGMTTAQAADALGISISTAERDWAYARAWLFKKISENS